MHAKLYELPLGEYEARIFIEDAEPEKHLFSSMEKAHAYAFKRLYPHIWQMMERGELIPGMNNGEKILVSKNHMAMPFYALDDAEEELVRYHLEKGETEL